MADNKKFIKKAIKRPGAFTAFCKSKGFDSVTDECIEQGMASESPAVKKQAVLARTLRKISAQRKTT